MEKKNQWLQLIFFHKFGSFLNINALGFHKSNFVYIDATTNAHEREALEIYI